MATGNKTDEVKGPTANNNSGVVIVIVVMVVLDLVICDWQGDRYKMVAFWITTHSSNKRVATYTLTMLASNHVVFSHSLSVSTTYGTYAEPVKPSVCFAFIKLKNSFQFSSPKRRGEGPSVSSQNENKHQTLNIEYSDSHLGNRRGVAIDAFFINQYCYTNTHTW